MNRTINLEDYPELKLIAWHRRPGTLMSEEEAFALYERNWRYIDPERLSPNEAALIEKLKRQYGRGVING